jgi:hypothetical protein
MKKNGYSLPPAPRAEKSDYGRAERFRAFPSRMRRPEFVMMIPVGPGEIKPFLPSTRPDAAKKNGPLTGAVYSNIYPLILYSRKAGPSRRRRPKGGG